MHAHCKTALAAGALHARPPIQGRTCIRRITTNGVDQLWRAIFCMHSVQRSRTCTLDTARISWHYYRQGSYILQSRLRLRMRLGPVRNSEAGTTNGLSPAFPSPRSRAPPPPSPFHRHTACCIRIANDNSVANDCTSIRQMDGEHPPLAETNPGEAGENSKQHQTTPTS